MKGYGQMTQKSNQCGTNLTKTSKTQHKEVWQILQYSTNQKNNKYARINESNKFTTVSKYAYLNILKPTLSFDSQISKAYNCQHDQNLTENPLVHNLSHAFCCLIDGSYVLASKRPLLKK